jgi:hypothetical protein
MKNATVKSKNLTKPRMSEEISMGKEEKLFAGQDGGLIPGQRCWLTVVHKLNLTLTLTRHINNIEFT